MKIPEHIFKSYDIRGLVEGELSEEVAERLGRAVVTFTNAKTVVVGRDMRESSNRFAPAVMRGVMAMGAQVVDIGLCSTPMFNFAVSQYRNHDVGIMVTASHNPKEWNGFKMALHNALPIGKGTGMEKIRDLVIAGGFEDAPKKGSMTSLDVKTAYLDKVFELAQMPSLSGMKVVVDVSNGMNGMLVEDFFDRLDCEWHGLFLDPDGTFPNHEANPLKPEAQEPARLKLEEVGADIGIIYDGDGDRVGFLDEKGRFVRGDLIAAFLIDEVLARHPGGIVFHDLRASTSMVEAVKAAGGIPKVSEVGHASVKRHLHEEGGVFGAELSSHFFFTEFSQAEATEYVVLLVLKKLKEQGKPFSELIDVYRTHATAEETNFRVDDREATIRRVEEHYAPLANRRLDIDGITFYYDDWWFNLRSSNTEPIVRLTLEAEEEAVMEKNMKEITELIAGERV